MLRFIWPISFAQKTTNKNHRQTIALSVAHISNDLRRPLNSNGTFLVRRNLLARDFARQGMHAIFCMHNLEKSWLLSLLPAGAIVTRYQPCEPLLLTAPQKRPHKQRCRSRADPVKTVVLFVNTLNPKPYTLISKSIWFQVRLGRVEQCLWKPGHRTCNSTGFT